jgi:hypothetical protein
LSKLSERREGARRPFAAFAILFVRLLRASGRRTGEELLNAARHSPSFAPDLANTRAGGAPGPPRREGARIIDRGTAPANQRLRRDARSERSNSQCEAEVVPSTILR